MRSNDTNYIPRASNFKDVKSENLSKSIDFENDNTLNNNYIKDIEKSEYPALIVSIEAENKTSINYYVIINPKEYLMNIFLIGSICIALVFAVIAFFLIRRKSSMGTKPSEDFYENKSGEEKED